MFLFTSSFWFAVIRSTTPVLFATLAVNIAAKSGVVNIAVEGMMLISALIGVLVSASTQSLILGALAGMAAGTIVALVLGFFIMKQKANPIVTGIAINLAALGGTTFLLYVITGDKSISSSLRSLTFPAVNIPIIENIPVVGQILSGHNFLTYVAILCMIALALMLKYTSFGFKIRSVGENPEAARSVGINVEKTRIISLGLSGIIASLGGMFLSMGYMSMFTANMTAGRGYMAMATDAMAASNPIGGFAASVIYGFSDSVAVYLQQSNIPLEIVQMLPYLFIIVMYSIYSVKRKRDNKEEIMF